MMPFPNEADLLAWKQAYRTLQAPASDACLTDEQFRAMLLEALQGEARTRLAAHLGPCQRCTDGHQWRRRWRPPGR